MSRLRQGFGGRGLLGSWLASPPPDAAVEITPDRVSAATLVSRGAALVVQSHAVEPLPAGAVVPSLTASNVVDRAAVASAVRSVLGRLGARAARVALVVPDVTAKVSLVHFDRLPPKRDDLDQLVRWQVRKSAPFAIDEACVTYSPAARAADGSAELVVALARRAVVQEYEQVCADAGAYAGLVDLATFSVVNLFLASPHVPGGDWLLVHMRPEYTSLVIARGEDMIFFRNRPEGDDDTLADLVHQTSMYYQDRLSGQGFSRVLLGGSGRVAGALDLAQRNLEERLGLPVEAVDPIRAVTLSDRIGASVDLMDILSPLVGILLRTRRESVAA